MGLGRRTRVVLAVTALATSASACGATADRSLCNAYASYLTAVDPVLAADPSAATAPQVVETLDEVIGSLQQLQAAADGRYAAAASDLQAALGDIRRTLEAVDADSDYSTWAPLVEDDIATATDAEAHLREVIDPACMPGS